LMMVRPCYAELQALRAGKPWWWRDAPATRDCKRWLEKTRLRALRNLSEEVANFRSFILSVDWFTHGFLHWIIHWFTPSLVDWFTDWLIHSFIHSLSFHSMSFPFLL
jgi:hypothetical protein